MKPNTSSAAPAITLFSDHDDIDKRVDELLRRVKRIGRSHKYVRCMETGMNQTDRESLSAVLSALRDLELALIGICISADAIASHRPLKKLGLNTSNFADKTFHSSIEAKDVVITPSRSEVLEYLQGIHKSHDSETLFLARLVMFHAEGKEGVDYMWDRYERCVVLLDLFKAEQQSASYAV